MATPNVGILTNSGKNLIDQVNAGQTKITFSKIVFSSMDNSQLTDDQIKALTAITPQEIVVNNPEVTLDNNTGETQIRATGNNEALTDGVYVKTYAVYAKDDSGNEILYGITVSPNPNYLPEYDGVTPQAVTYSYKVNISNTSNITFTNSNDIYVSDTDLAEALQPYAKTVDVNQQLDKKVNVSDMRKPASDVAGIEEVNAKQDKIGYTPADDSKVVHNSDTANWQKVKITDDNGNTYSQLLKDSSSSWESSNGGWATPEKTISLTAGVEYFISAEFKCSGVDTSGIELQLSGAAGTNTATFSTLYGSSTIGSISKGFIASGTQGFLYIGPFTPTITGNYHIVGGIENSSNTGYWRKITVTASNTYVPWETAMANSISPIDNQDDTISINGKSYTPADDSKVAHLSGANNFDTVPTVDNNPLLLASSLPSDLARTGQVQTFTAAQTFSIAPTITDASKDKGDNQAATMADLKSVENSAWHQLDSKYINTNKFSDAAFYYKINNEKKNIEFFGFAYVSFPVVQAYTQIWFADLSSLIKPSSNKEQYASVGTEVNINDTDRIYAGALNVMLKSSKVLIGYETIYSSFSNEIFVSSGVSGITY